MKVAIVGSRSFADYGRMVSFLEELCLSRQITIDLIISGGAHGADALAERLASEYEIPTEIYKADWAQYGKRAGYIRNRLIIAACDICIAFWDGMSKGTKMDIDLCSELGKECIICRYDSDSTSAQPQFFRLREHLQAIFSKSVHIT